jgi:hypothetical protein
MEQFMPFFPKPHTPEWLTALEAFDPRQAAHTRQVIARAKSADVCSVCGDDPSSEYKATMANLPAKAVATIRLCDDCRQIRSTAGESFVAL